MRIFSHGSKPCHAVVLSFMKYNSASTKAKSMKCKVYTVYSKLIISHVKILPFQRHEKSQTAFYTAIAIKVVFSKA